MKIIAVSHDQRLAEQLHADFRKIVESPRYKAIFPHFAISPIANTKDNLETAQGGGRRAISIDSSPTGLGASFIILDDPLSSGDANNPEQCDRNFEQVTKSVLSRRDDFNVPVVVVQQRLSENDTTAKFENLPGWIKLSLPLVAIQDEQISLSTGAVYTRKEGDILSPTRTSNNDVASMRHLLADHFEVQYQQNPGAMRGTLLVEADLPTLERVPPNLDCIISIDTAPHGRGGQSRTAVLVIGSSRGRHFVIDAVAKKLEFDEILETVVRLAEIHGARRVLVEDAGIGHSVIQQLQQKGLVVSSCKTGSKSKTQRLAAVIGRFKANEVVTYAGQPGTREFREELLRFPYGQNDDQVDALTQYLAWIEGVLPSGHAPVTLGVSSAPHSAQRMSPFTRENGMERRLPPGFRPPRGRYSYGSLPHRPLRYSSSFGCLRR